MKQESQQNGEEQPQGSVADHLLQPCMSPFFSKHQICQKLYTYCCRAYRCEGTCNPVLAQNLEVTFTSVPQAIVGNLCLSK